MQSKKRRFIDQWIEGVSAASQSTNAQDQQGQQELLVHSLFKPQQPNVYQPHALKIAKTRSMKRTNAPRDITPPFSKKAVAENPSVHFSGTATHAGGMPSSHFHSSSTQAQRQKLRFADPPVLFLPFETKEEVPEGILRLYGEILDRLDSSLPSSLVYEKEVSRYLCNFLRTKNLTSNLYRSLLKAHELRRSEVSELLEGLSEQDAELWRCVRSAVRKSNFSFESTGDETQWTEVVRPLLEHGVSDKTSDLFEVVPMYGFSIFILFFMICRRYFLNFAHLTDEPLVF